MLIPVRNPLTGKLICKWDCENKMIEIVQHKKQTKIFLQSDGSYQVNDMPKQTPLNNN